MSWSHRALDVVPTLSCTSKQRYSKTRPIGQVEVITGLSPTTGSRVRVSYLERGIQLKVANVEECAQAVAGLTTNSQLKQMKYCFILSIILYTLQIAHC